jgi:hypothetical protein
MTIRFESSVQSIRLLKIKHWAGVKNKSSLTKGIAKKVVYRVGHTFFFLTNDGYLTSPDLRHREIYVLGHSSRDHDCLQAAVTMGLITKDDLKEHNAACDKAIERNRFMDDVLRLEGLIRKYGNRLEKLRKKIRSRKG